MEIEFVRRMWRLCGGGMLNLAEEKELPVDKYPFYTLPRAAHDRPQA